MAYKRTYKKLTTSEEYHKKMRELDKWIKDDMIKNEAVIEQRIQDIIRERNEQG